MVDHYPGRSDPYASTELEASEGDLEEGGDKEPGFGSSDRNFDQDGNWAHWTGHRWDTDREQDNSDKSSRRRWGQHRGRGSVDRMKRKPAGWLRYMDHKLTKSGLRYF